MTKPASPGRPSPPNLNGLARTLTTRFQASSMAGVIVNGQVHFDICIISGLYLVNFAHALLDKAVSLRADDRVCDCADCTASFDAAAEALAALEAASNVAITPASSHTAVH